MNKEINFKKITSKYEKDVIKTTKDFVAIKSVYDESTIDNKNPFGKGVSDALSFFYKLASSDGFSCTNYDNKIVEAIIGKGDKNITIMAHADVVPEGNGWTSNPYEVRETKTTLFGRGVADDKGPCMAAYYALKALKDNHLLGKYKVRFLVGGNEERGSACMTHYFQVLKKEQPTFGFSPDSNFPLIYAEKGIFNFTVSKECSIPGVISIEGGVASNAVIDRCVVKFALDSEIVPFIVENYPNADILTRDDVVNVTFKGVAAHGSTPQLGVNAAMIAFDAIHKYTKNKTLETIIKRYTDVYGIGINAYANSKDMHKNSSNVGIVSYKNGVLSFIVNFRFVNGCDPEQLKKNIKEANKGFKVEFGDVLPILYIPKNSPLVKTLMHAYVAETGDTTSKPLAIGGGTYAKEASNTIAFGCEFPGYDPHMHGADECIEKEHLFKGMAIYARAIYELGQLIDENKI